MPEVLVGADGLDVVVAIGVLVCAGALVRSFFNDLFRALEGPEE